MKLIAGLSALFLLAYLVLIIVFSMATVDSIKSAENFYTNSMPREQEGVTTFDDNYFSQNHFDLRTEDTLKRLQAVSDSLYKDSMASNKRYFYFEIAFIIFLSLMIVLALASIFTSRVEIDGDSLKFYYPVNSMLGPLAKPFVIDINSIKLMRANRTTPFGPDMKTPDEMNWRDRIIIDNRYIVSGVMYSGIGKIYKKIIEINPRIKTETYKNTIYDNIQESETRSF